MDEKIIWMKPPNSRVPSLYDVAILQVLADAGEFLNPFEVYRRVKWYGAMGGGTGHNMTALLQKELVSEQKVGDDPYRHVAITAKGQTVLELCRKTSLVFKGIEDSFEEVGW